MGLEQTDKIESKIIEAKGRVLAERSGKPMVVEYDDDGGWTFLAVYDSVGNTVFHMALKAEPKTNSAFEYTVLERDERGFPVLINQRKIDKEATLPFLPVREVVPAETKIWLSWEGDKLMAVRKSMTLGELKLGQVFAEIDETEYKYGQKDELERIATYETSERGRFCRQVRYYKNTYMPAIGCNRVLELVYRRPEQNMAMGVAKIYEYLFDPGRHCLVYAKYVNAYRRGPKSELRELSDKFPGPYLREKLFGDDRKLVHLDLELNFPQFINHQ